MSWQPIETAPKDGTMVDLWVPSKVSPGHRWTNVFWGKPDHECGESGEYCDSDWHSARPGWVCSTFQEFISGKPTHWMSVPQPPSPPKDDATNAPDSGRAVIADSLKAFSPGVQR